jgi:hypothetical protein
MYDLPPLDMRLLTTRVEQFLLSFNAH